MSVDGYSLLAPDQALDTVLLTKVYWSHSTSIVCVRFTLLPPPTIRNNPKRKRNLQINVNSLALASFYKLLCYHSLEHSDAILDEFLTFIQSTLSFLIFQQFHPFYPKQQMEMSTILKFYDVFHTNFRMFNPETNESFPRRGLVRT